MKKLVPLLIKKGYTISSVESLTAGLFSASVASIPNASKVLKGALVTYTNECKMQVLGVEEEIINTFGVISSQCVSAMVVHGKMMFNTDIVVAFSGNAGPSVMEQKEAGLVYMALLYNEQIVIFKEIFKGNRDEVRKQCVEYMVQQIKLHIK